MTQPTLLTERVEIARGFTRDYNLSSIPILVDDPECASGRESESFEKHFAPWPLRFFILAEGVVVCYLAYVICLLFFGRS